MWLKPNTPRLCRFAWTPGEIHPRVDLQFQAGLARDQGGALRAPLLGNPEVRGLAQKITVNVP